MNAIQKAIAKFDMIRFGVNPDVRNRMLEIAQYGSMRNGTKVKTVDPNFYKGDLKDHKAFVKWLKQANIAKSTVGDGLSWMRNRAMAPATQRFLAKHAFAGLGIRAQIKEHVRILNKPPTKHVQNQDAVIAAHKDALKSILKQDHWAIYSPEYKALKDKEFIEGAKIKRVIVSA